MEIFVFLHQNRPDVPFCPFPRFVVEGGNHQTKGKLLVLVDVVFLFKVLSLFICEGGGPAGVLPYNEPPFFDPHQVLLRDVAVVILQVGVFLDVI